MPSGDWSSIRPERLAELMEQGEGPSRPRQTATLFGQLRDTLETLGSDVDSLLAQLLTAWSSEASDRAAQALQRYSTGLRDMAAVADTVSQQAEAHADANESARSSMPKLEDILKVLAQLAAARASQNYGLVAALMALYQTLSSQASSTMQGYESATVSNQEQQTVQEASSITDSSSGASDSVAQLMESFNGQSDQSSASTDQMDDPFSSPSSTLAELDGRGFGGGGGGFSGIPGAIRMAMDTAGAVSSIVTGFPMPLGVQATPGALGLPSSGGGVPASAPMSGGGPGMMGHGGQRRRERDKEQPLPGVVVASNEDVVPQIGLGVVVDVDEPEDRPA